MAYRDAADGGGGLSDTEQAAIVQVAQACASLSFLGSAVIVVANFRFKQVSPCCSETHKPGALGRLVFPPSLLLVFIYGVPGRPIPRKRMRLYIVDVFFVEFYELCSGSASKCLQTSC